MRGLRQRSVVVSAASITLALMLAACGGSSNGDGSVSASDAKWDATPSFPVNNGGSGGNGGNSGNGGNGGNTPTDDNTAEITVDGFRGVNQPFVSVRFCLPNQTDAANCVTVDHMLVDTGSIGVRVLASALGDFANRLPVITGATDDKTGNAPIVECAMFGSGFTFGPLKRSSMTIGGKTSTAIPMQVFDNSTTRLPDECVAEGGLNLGTLEAAGINGIVGVDAFTYESLTAVDKADSSPFYYCPTNGGACVRTRLAAEKQPTNPVWSFARDNNGIVIRMPALPTEGMPAVVRGQLIFGVGTRANNTLPALVTPIPLDKYGLMKTVYKGRGYSHSAIDSGTNFMMFNDAAIPTSNGYFVPPSPMTINTFFESNTDTKVSLMVTFPLGNALSLIGGRNVAFNNIGAEAFNGWSNSEDLTLWGMPFFYGRSVYFVNGGAAAGSVKGPAVAFN